MQKHVFFHIWHPNSTLIKMERCVCTKCGFVIDLPRPDEQDIAKKYEYLAIVEKDLGSTKGLKKRAMNLEYRQAIDILRLAESLIKSGSRALDILDYGGGDGHLLVPMIQEGHNCYLVDYNKYPLPGITHLGNTIEDISLNYKFDLIICRHVLEHVASPNRLITDLKNYLKNEGVMYAEVPIQIFSAKKPNKDPVTHINYFHEESLNILFQSACYKTIEYAQKVSTYHGTPYMIAYILAKYDTQEQSIHYKDSYEKTIALLCSSSFNNLNYFIKYPSAYLMSFKVNCRRKALTLFFKIFKRNG